MTYRATALTQRDGSSLQNSNCRMTSIAVGLDYDTLGAKKSSGGKMRSFTSDQSGGTDSGDAREAWAKGYKETLVVRDGQPWSQAVSDLKAGRLVHLDVWHATLSEVCVSGDGRYGHTVAVAPEQDSAGRWLVCDPWCKPGRWAWVSERQLRLGAEDWGNRVFNRATAGRTSPLPPVGSEELGLILAAMGRYLMNLYTPEQRAGPEDLPPTDTGGPPPVLYTVTAAHPEEVDVPALQLTLPTPYDGTAVVKEAGASWIRIWDGAMGPASVGFTKKVSAKAVVDATWTTSGGVSVPKGEKVVIIGDDLAVLIERNVTLTPNTPPPPVDVYVPVGDLYVKKV